MDPINALVLSAPPEWIPVLVIAALVLKGFTAWLDRKKTAQLLDATPSHDAAPETVEITVVPKVVEPSEPTLTEIQREPDVKG